MRMCPNIIISVHKCIDNHFANDRFWILWNLFPLRSPDSGHSTSIAAEEFESRVNLLKKRACNVSLTE
jgi:hypothetical protein